MPEKYDIAILIRKHNNQETTPEEEQFLQEWIHRNEENEACYNRLTDPELVLKKLAVYVKPDVRLARYKVQQKITERRRRKRTIRITLAAAAIVGLLFYLTFYKEKDNTTTITKQTIKAPASAPFGKALLFIENEALLNLDTVKDGLIGEFGDIRIEKEKQVITYKSMGSSPKGGSVYSKLITGASCQYQVILPDKSAIDLSASSWIRIGSSSNVQERRLELAGQAYFNITHDAQKPFIVTVNKAEIQVLGTEFNVNAYDVNGSIKTALIKGHVKIKSGNLNADLFQDQIATVIPGQSINTQDANVNKETTWRDFIFEKDNILTVMGELSKWYGIEVKYVDTPAVSISTVIPRTFKLDEVLNQLDELHIVSLNSDAVKPKLVIVSEWKGIGK